MKVSTIWASPTFCAGKIQVYSDFDGTYFPARHNYIKNDQKNSFMKDYCRKMDKFFQDTIGNLHFHITTGRTFGEYKTISHLLKNKELQLPLPESFISKNGGDEFIKNGTNSNFYADNIFPYKYSEPNKLKEEFIKKNTNWDGKKIKDYIRNLAQNYQLTFIEADSEHSAKDYGNNSLFSAGKLNPNEWKKIKDCNDKIQEHVTPIVDFILGSRNDGNLKINLIFPPDYGYCPERNNIYDKFINNIKNFLSENKIDFFIDWIAPNKHNHYRKHCNITPKIDNKALTKLFDTQHALDNAISNNDLLIAAGDGSNDFDMLNPLEYIKAKDWEKFKENTKCAYFYEASNHKKLSYIREAYEGKNPILKQELESSGLIKQIQDMPFYSIVVNKKDSSLQELLDTFARFGKIIAINKGELDKGIKYLIKQYAEKSHLFKEAMSEKLKAYIWENSESHKNRNRNKALIISGLVFSTICIAGLVHIYNKFAKQDKFHTSKKEKCNLH